MVPLSEMVAVVDLLTSLLCSRKLARSTYFLSVEFGAYGAATGHGDSRGAVVHSRGNRPLLEFRAGTIRGDSGGDHAGRQPIQGPCPRTKALLYRRSDSQLTRFGGRMCSLPRVWDVRLSLFGFERQDHDYCNFRGLGTTAQSGAQRLAPWWCHDHCWVCFFPFKYYSLS